MTGASSQVPEFAHSLCEQTGIRVVLIDSRGCGKSTCEHPLVNTQYTQAQMATDLVAVANALGIDRFSVGGQSYGTRVSLFTAAIAKGRVDKVSANLCQNSICNHFSSWVSSQFLTTRSSQVVLVVPPPITFLGDKSLEDTRSALAKMLAAMPAQSSDPTQPTEAELLSRVPTWKGTCTARKDLPNSLALREMTRGASNSLNPGFATYLLQVGIDAR
jgi:pimeloyl-ACP methyl ester carboxylesterase